MAVTAFAQVDALSEGSLAVGASRNFRNVFAHMLDFVTICIFHDASPDLGFSVGNGLESLGESYDLIHIFVLSIIVDCGFQGIIGQFPNSASLREANAQRLGHALLDICERLFLCFEFYHVLHH